MSSTLRTLARRDARTYAGRWHVDTTKKTNKVTTDTIRKTRNKRKALAAKRKAAA